MKALASSFVAITALAAAGAQADTLSYTSNTAALSRTNWSSFLDLQQFNPALGTLNSVTVELFGQVQGNARAESLDASASVVALNLASQLTLKRPDASTLVVTLPTASNSFNATSFDGALNWSGTSGKSYLDIGASSSASMSSSAAADLSLFTGLGTVHAPLAAVGKSSASGNANLFTFFETYAGGYATVTYAYTPAVPEPETWALMLAGLGAVGLLARRRAA